MDTAIITGLISAGAALVVCLINNHYQMAESNKKHEANIMLISYRLEQLEKKVDLHNSVVERVFKLEESTSLQEEKIKVANHRIDDLEKGDDRR